MTSYIVPNTWQSEFNSWFNTLQETRKKDFEEKLESREAFDPSLHLRNWGHINHQFATHFFDLLDKLKVANPELFEEYCEKANRTLFFWDLNDPDVFMNYEEYTNEKDK